MFYKKPTWTSWKNTENTGHENKSIYISTFLFFVFPPFMHAKIGEWIDGVPGC